MNWMWLWCIIGISFILERSVASLKSQDAVQEGRQEEEASDGGGESEAGRNEGVGWKGETRAEATTDQCVSQGVALSS